MAETLTLPSGQKLNIPEGMDKQTAENVARAQFPQLYGTTALTPTDKTGLFPALGAGIDLLQQSLYSAGEGATGALGLEGASKYLGEQAAQQGREARESLPDQMAFGEVDSVGDALRAAAEGIGTSLPFSAPSIAGGAAGAKLGAGIGAAGGPLGSLAGTVIGGIIGGVIPFYGLNRERQKEALGSVKNELSAFGAAVPQAGMDALLGRLIPGVGKGFTGGIMSRVGKGTVAGAATEVPTEVAQQMLERFQAGLPIDSEDAIEEYREAAIAGGVLGGVLGGPFGALDRAPTGPEQPPPRDQEEAEKRDPLYITDQREPEKPPAPSQQKLIGYVDREGEAVDTGGAAKRLREQETKAARRHRDVKKQIDNAVLKGAKTERKMLAEQVRQVSALPVFDDIMVDPTELSGPVLERVNRSLLREGKAPLTRGESKPLSELKKAGVPSPVLQRLAREKYPQMEALEAKRPAIKQIIAKALKMNIPLGSYGYDLTNLSIGELTELNSAIDRVKEPLTPPPAEAAKGSDSAVGPDAAPAMSPVDIIPPGFTSSFKVFPASQTKLQPGQLKQGTRDPEKQQRAGFVLAEEVRGPDGVPYVRRGVQSYGTQQEANEALFSTMGDSDIQARSKEAKAQLARAEARIAQLQKDLQAREETARQFDKLNDKQVKRQLQSQRQLIQDQQVDQQMHGQTVADAEAEIRRRQQRAQARPTQNQQEGAPTDPRFEAFRMVAKSVFADRAKELGLENSRARLEVVRELRDEDGAVGEGTEMDALIRLSYEALPRGLKNRQEVKDYIAGVLNHEMIHALVTMGKITDAEFQTLLDAAKNTEYVDPLSGNKVPLADPRTGRPTGRNATFYDRARNAYSGQPQAIQNEEAITELFRSWASGKAEIKGKPKGILERLVDWFRKLFRMAETDPRMARAAKQTLSDIAEGRVGRREEGTGYQRGVEAPDTAMPQEGAQARFSVRGRDMLMTVTKRTPAAVGGSGMNRKEAEDLQQAIYESYGEQVQITSYAGEVQVDFRTEDDAVKGDMTFGVYNTSTDEPLFYIEYAQNVPSFDEIQGQGDKSKRANVRDVLTLALGLKLMQPEVRFLAGYRISGAKHTNLRDNVPEYKLMQVYDTKRMFGDQDLKRIDMFDGAEQLIKADKTRPAKPRYSRREAVFESTDNLIADPDPVEFAGKLREFFEGMSWTKFRQAFINKFESIGRNGDMVYRDKAGSTEQAEQRADTSAHVAAQMAMRSKGIFQAAIMEGIPKVVRGANGGSWVTVRGKEDDGGFMGFKEIVQDIYSMGLDKQAQHYLAAKRHMDIERRRIQRERDNEQGAGLPDIPPSGLTDQQVADGLAIPSRLSAEERQAIEKFEQDYNTWNNALVDFMADTGLISQQAKEDWRDSAYIPFYTMRDDDIPAGPRAQSGLANAPRPRRRKGGEKGVEGDQQAPKMAPLLEMVSQNAMWAIEAGTRNWAAQKAIRDAEYLGIGAEIPAAKAKQYDMTVKVLQDGEQKTYSIADDLTYAALTSLTPRVTAGWLNVMAWPAQVLRSMVTKDPGFMAANLMRDTMSAWVTSGQSFWPVIDTVKGVRSALKGGATDTALRRGGIHGGYDFKNDAEAAGAFLRNEMGERGVLGQFWKKLDDWTTASDMGTRIAVYDRVYKETGNEAEATWAALEVMNFSRTGSSPLIQGLAMVVPFLNARIQGLDVLARAATGSGKGKGTTADAKKIQKQFLVRGGLMFLGGAMYAMWASGEDWYDKQPPEVRDNYWMAPFPGTDKLFSFPIPFEVGVLFKVLPEHIVRGMYRDYTSRDAWNATKRHLGETLGLNPIPQAALPALEAVTNYSFFLGREIEPLYMQNLPAEQRYNIYTSEIAKGIGGAFDVSPMRIEQMLRGYSGTLGTYALQMMDVAMRDGLGIGVEAPSLSAAEYPVMKRFLNRQEGSGLKADFYDLANQVDQAYNGYQNLMKQGRAQDALEMMKDRSSELAVRGATQGMRQQLAALRRRRRQIEFSDIDDTRKREMIDQIIEMENNLLQQVKGLRERAFS